ncbi:MBOAT family O-acyltransferase [Helcococcus kunzii]|uniref:MBOAT family O-acyltransferase n=1 Tax=Helcococcus kunzii TaxID=40091 RepID=UPI0024AD0BB2|nr:MBOAT family O-acyltransferase [Helcococcus kunzii]
MVFSSLFFVYMFLPLNLLFYYMAKDIKTKNIIMLLFSLLFYSWNSPKYLILLLVMTLNGWIGAQLIQRFRKNGKIFLITTISIFLLILGYFKYAGFFVEIFNFLSPKNLTVPNIILPIGISFYTFQLLSYVVDVYREEVSAQKNFFLLLLYVSLFHQCIAGPIVRYSDVEYDILNRKLNYKEIKDGVKRFCYGLGKKAILANGIAVVADKYLLLNDINALKEVPALGIWLGALAFAFQIYFDFSAYSDMAIGMGLMTGFHYKENFQHPYVSRTITEFWRRWHISLGSFFRDYVYIPLGGNRTGNLFVNLFVVWFLTGMWHGASWNYILWGLYFFVFLVFEKMFFKKVLDNAPKIISWAITFIVLLIGWILFKFENFDFMIAALKGMFGLNGNEVVNSQVLLTVKNNIFLILFCFIASTTLFKNLYEKAKSFSMRRKSLLVPLYDTFTPWVILLISTLALIGNSYNPFLYFQF